MSRTCTTPRATAAAAPVRSRRSRRNEWNVDDSTGTRVALARAQANPGDLCRRDAGYSRRLRRLGRLARAAAACAGAAGLDHGHRPKWKAVARLCDGGWALAAAGGRQGI